MSSIYEPDGYQYAISPATLREIDAEIPLEIIPEPVSGLADPFEVFSTLPEDALLFGLASDGLPLLLHLREPQPGPILVVGDQGSGKTDFLKTILLSTQRLMPPGAVQFTVLTSFPDEWEQLSAPDHLIGVWDAGQAQAADLLYQLVCHLESPAENQPTVLLFDGLDALQQFSAAEQSDLARILMHGPQRLIWPLVSLNAELAIELPYWVAFFKTRIFGQVVSPRAIRALTSLPGAPLGSLSAPGEFCLREKSHWLKFRRPSLLG